MNSKWVLIGLVFCGLLFYGYKVYTDQMTHGPNVSRGPISVAAVRGNSQAVDAGDSSASNVVTEYAGGLRDDVSKAERNAKKYEAAGKASMEAARKSLEANQ